MRSALLSVQGVMGAQVSFADHEAVVEYDPARCRVDDLIAAVGSAKAEGMPVPFRAAVKK